MGVESRIAGCAGVVGFFPVVCSRVVELRGARDPAFDPVLVFLTRCLTIESAMFGPGVVQRPVDALEYLRAAHDRSPWSPQINFYLGEAYGRTGKKERARMHFTKTAYWHPDASWRQRAHAALRRLTP